MVSTVIPVQPFDLVIFGATGDLSHRPGRVMSGWERERMDLGDRRILVTGAGSGIGRATVERLRAGESRGSKALPEENTW